MKHNKVNQNGRELVNGLFMMVIILGLVILGAFLDDLIGKGGF